MIVYTLIQVILLISLFALWIIDSMYYSLGFLAFHVYPIFMAIIAILFKNKVKNSDYLTKIVALMIPMILWTVGVVLIYNIG